MLSMQTKTLADAEKHLGLSCAYINTEMVWKHRYDLQTLFTAGGICVSDLQSVLFATRVQCHCYCASVYFLMLMLGGATRAIHNLQSYTRGIIHYFRGLRACHLKTVLPKLHQHVEFLSKDKRPLINPHDSNP